MSLILPAHPPLAALWPRRIRKWWSLPAFLSGHLHHGSSGHLLHNHAGHLVNACAATANCPTGCGSCASRYTLTVSGIGGPGPSCCIGALNGTFTLTRTSSSNCQWTSGVSFQSGGCTFGWQLTCSLVDCHNATGSMLWVVQLYGSVTFVWAQLASTAACPPTGSYAICANPCTGGTGASVVVSS